MPMFDARKARRQKWKARMMEARHRCAAAWHHARAREADWEVRAEHRWQRFRRAAAHRLHAARAS